MACKCVHCPDCNGSGRIWTMYDHTGKLVSIGTTRSDDLEDLESCPSCGGSGIDDVCEECEYAELEAQEEEERNQ